MEADDSDDKDSKRKSRNLSEKKRRDQFNLLVNELSSMVSTSGRKMDKSTVLKCTIAFLKSHNELAVRSRINEIQEDWKPTFLTNEEFTHLALEAVDGFIIVFSTAGRIYYVSESVTSLLGYIPKNILNMSIFELVGEEDYTTLCNLMLNPVLEDRDNRVSFSCHLKRRNASKEPDMVDHCELVHFFGYFQPEAEDMGQNNEPNSKFPFTNDHGEPRPAVFVGTAKIQTPLLIKEMPLTESGGRTEFTSRHSLEWKFLFLDHRAPPIIGYLPFELLGTSGYEYYHVDDLDKVIDCHESLMQKGEGTSCYYRFLTKGQQWIWLQTRFYITYHQWNSKPEFVVCTHRVVSYLDVVNQGKRRQEPSSPDDSPTQWRGNSRGGPFKKGQADSDCTSMSADSPASKQSSVVTEKSSVTSLVNQQSIALPSPLSEHSPRRSHTNHPGHFLEPQYVAAIPLQPVLASYPPHVPQAILSPLPVETLPIQNQLQADLQRKQAELQAIIGQQQQELRRVSEQLLMARLGILQQDQQQPATAVSVRLSSFGKPLIFSNNCLINSTPVRMLL
ncbi:hypothetical protein ABEB36_002003 [Hypothenemus hampei]|uniref:Circadian locomoter output cycles protein kaput n=1 Tax=Hypothenemus hampei TaxID=57062 RepID=A0ABD1FGD5_HYPHA